MIVKDFKNAFDYRIRRVQNIPLYHIDLEPIEKLYPGFKDWVKYSAFEKDCIGVYDQNVLVGFCIFSKKDNHKYFDGDNVYKISSLYISPRYRRQSIATIMIEYLRFTYRPDVIYITVKSECYDMRNFLFKLGFKYNSEIKTRTNELVMVKNCKGDING